MVGRAFQSLPLSLMAGQPIRQQLEHDIEAKGGTEWLLAQVRERTLKSIYTELGVSAWQLDRYIHRLSPADKAELKRARASASVQRAEDELMQADSPSAMSMARERARFEMWVAERVDRDAWGQQPAQQVQVTINTLHLDALRSATVTSPILPHEQVKQLSAGDTSTSDE